MATQQKKNGGKLSNRKQQFYYNRYIQLQNAINALWGEFYNRCEAVLPFTEDVEQFKDKIQDFYGDYMQDFMIGYDRYKPSYEEYLERPEVKTAWRIQNDSTK